MARFRHRLETLLKLREFDRQQRRAELAEAYRADQILDEQIENVGQEITATKRAAKSAAGARQVDVGRLLDMNRYELVLRTQTATLVERKRQLQEEIERRRDAVIEADRQVRVLEKLRERKLADHLEEESRWERIHLDEVASRQSREARQ